MCFFFTNLPSVLAHANLLHSSPGQDQVLETSPERISLTFSEALEPDLVTVTLYDANGLKVDVSAPQLQSGNASQVNVPLPPLAEGSYTVVWSVVSEDGHPVSDSFVFAIGHPSAQVAKPGANLAAHASDFWLISLRYIMEGLILLGGGFRFIHHYRKQELPHSLAAFQQIHKIVWALILLSIVTLWFVYQRYLAEIGVSVEPLGENFALLLQSPFSGMLLSLFVLTILLVIPNMVEGWYLVVWGLLVGALAFGGHVWGTSFVWLSLLLRVLHVLSISLWMGALLYPMIAYRSLTLSRERFRVFFLRVVSWSAFVSIISGVLLVFTQTNVQLVLTEKGAWSILLTNKVVAVLFMLFLALLQNRQHRLIHRLSISSQGSNWLLFWEFALGLLAVLSGVWMSQINYPI